MTEMRVLLTGASGEIGAEAARALARDGARLALSGRREETLGALAREIAAAGAPAPAVLTANLGERGAAAELARRAVEALGGVDALVNNAGSSVQGLTWRVGDRDEAREVFETNLWSPLALAAALVPHMVGREQGVVVNVGSMARVSPFPHLGHYAASRAALSLVTEVMRMELEPRGVRVSEVALGVVDTRASRENRVLTGAEAWLDGWPGAGDPSAAAAAIVRAVRGPGGPVFYPRVMRWVDRFPALGRRHSRRAARGADPRDETVRFGGRVVAGD